MYKVWISGGGWCWRYTRGAIPARTAFKWMGRGDVGGGGLAGAEPWCSHGKEAEAPAKETTKVAWPLDPETRCILTPIPTPRLLFATKPKEPTFRKTFRVKSRSPHGLGGLSSGLAPPGSPPSVLWAGVDLLCALQGKAHTSLGSTCLCPPEASTVGQPDLAWARRRHRNMERYNSERLQWSAARLATSHLSFPPCSSPASPWMPPVTGCSVPLKAAMFLFWLVPPGTGSRLEEGAVAGHGQETVPLHCLRVRPGNMSSCPLTGRRPPPLTSSQTCAGPHTFSSGPLIATGWK